MSNENSATVGELARQLKQFKADLKEYLTGVKIEKRRDTRENGG